MKTAKLLLLCLTVLFFSCSDNEDPQPTSKGMVGSWAISAIDYKGTTTVTEAGKSEKIDYAGTGKDMNLTATFTENPNNVTTVGSYKIVLKITQNGQTKTEEFELDEAFSNGTWSLSGNALTITSPDGPETVTIAEQNATTLKVKEVVNETETDQGITTTAKFEAVYTFKKK
jgi:hypothetical protein